MSRLSGVSGRECVRALTKAGFRVLRQRSSHISLCREEPFAQVVVPDHKEVGLGLLRKVIRDAGLTVDEFVELLKQ